MKGQTWLEVADSAKGTLVTGVVADETVEVVAPCIMGTFFRRVRQETREGGGGGEEECYEYHDKICQRNRLSHGNYVFMYCKDDVFTKVQTCKQNLKTFCFVTF